MLAVPDFSRLQFSPGKLEKALYSWVSRRDPGKHPPTNLCFKVQGETVRGDSMHLIPRNLTPKSVYVLCSPLPQTTAPWEAPDSAVGLGVCLKTRESAVRTRQGLGGRPCCLLLLKTRARRSLLRTGLRDPGTVPLRAGCLLTLDCVLPDHAPALTH